MFAGVINDLQETISQIVYASDLPLSIVIVGVVSGVVTAMRRVRRRSLTCSRYVLLLPCRCAAGCCGL